MTPFCGGGNLGAGARLTGSEWEKHISDQGAEFGVVWLKFGLILYRGWFAKKRDVARCPPNENDIA